MQHTFLSTLGAIALAMPAHAGEFQPAMAAFLENEISGWVNAQIIVDAINEQNAVTSRYGETDVVAMDNAWRSEVGTDDRPTITKVLSHPASDFLRDQVAASGGVVTEVFIMDSVGLNVAASDVTSDMWQGDEDKFSKSYGMGIGGVHYGEVEFDESTQSFQGQISVTIVDSATGEAIGAITIGLNADALL